MEGSPNYYVLGQTENGLKLTKTNSNIAQGLEFPNVGEEKYLVKNAALSAAYKGIIGKKAHYLENGKLRSRVPLDREQVKKFAFTGGR